MDTTASGQQSFLISLKPQFVAAVIGRKKAHEYRRARWRITPQDRVLVYESRGRSAIVGAFTAGVVLYGRDALAQLGSSELRDETLEYLQGATAITAVEILNPQIFHLP